MAALPREFLEHRLAGGQAGAVVELLSPTVAELEFSDDEGRAYAMAALPVEELIRRAKLRSGWQFHGGELVGQRAEAIIFPRQPSYTSKSPAPAR